MKGFPAQINFFVVIRYGGLHNFNVVNKKTLKFWEISMFSVGVLAIMYFFRVP